MRLLEEELSLNLFERDRGRLIPTASATALGKIARDLLEQVHLAQRATRMISTGVVQHLLCVTTRTAVESILVPFISSLDTSYPLITTREFAHGDVEHALSEGADFGLFPLPPAPHLTSRTVAILPISASVAHDHHWAIARKSSVCLKDLVSEFLLLPPSSALTRQEIDHALRLAGLALSTHVVSDVDTVRVALAASGRGVAVTTGGKFPHVWTMPIVDSEGHALTISLYTGWQAGHYASEFLGELSDRLRSFIDDELNYEKRVL